MTPVPDATDGPDTLVRAAVPGDLEAIVALHTRARASYYRGRLPEALLDDPAERARWREAWAGAIERPDDTVLCAERAGTTVGIASFRGEEPARPDVVMLHQLHVDPAHWRSGVGSALHGACVSAWRAAGHSAARLQVYWHNRRARDFYARHGWRPDESRRPAPDDTHLSLLLTLSPGAR
ncbi:GNAT family N-acetyltransferase [Streptomyces sp. Ru73]|uniref:GNAT family N-acetyltransferase n=1 Tax=Streptomyces sp. Ru73 TaxID=2080748 RepID=UPI0027E55021|nr:GNAT family N-acetyltransferase [Streptomyces sp. Ru73]